MNTIFQLCIKSFRWSSTLYFFSPLIKFWISTTPNARVFKDVVLMRGCLSHLSIYAMPTSFCVP